MDTENEEVVVLSFTQNKDGTEEYHGHVPTKLEQDQANALKKSEELMKQVKLKDDGTYKVR